MNYGASSYVLKRKLANRSMIYIRFLGTAATQPCPKRNASSILLKYKTKRILIDCGENCTRSLLKYDETLDIDVIFITHMHGDHWYGVLGLIDTLNKNNRTKPLHIYGPNTIIKIRSILELLNKKYSFVVNLLPISENVSIEIDVDLIVSSYKMHHGTLCYGYLFEYLILPKIDKNKLLTSGFITGEWCKDLVSKNTFVYEGIQYDSKQFYKCDERRIKIFFSGDSLPVNHNLNVDYLIHECTYYDDIYSAKLKKHTSYLPHHNLIKKYYSPTVIFYTHISEKFDAILHKLPKEPLETVFVNDGGYIQLEN